MIRFIFRRILETIPVLWAVATITFFMLRLAPGGPFDDERQVSPEVLRTLQAHYGLDKPLMAQYRDNLLNLLKGHDERSLMVADAIRSAMRVQRKRLREYNPLQERLKVLEKPPRFGSRKQS